MMLQATAAAPAPAALPPACQPALAPAPEVLLPHEWYSHAIQSAMLGAGLRLPVDADALAAQLEDRGLLAPGARVPRDASGACYVPGVPDAFVVGLSQAPGSPLALRRRAALPGRLIAAITPPLACFDNAHLLGAKVITTRRGGLARVCQKDAPPHDLQDCVRECVDYAMQALAARFPGLGLEVLGARLNKLTSGLMNVLLFVALSGGEHGVMRQEYVRGAPRAGHQFERVRIIPDPGFEPPSSLFNVRLHLERAPRAALDDAAFEALFGRLQDVVLSDAFLPPGQVRFRHLKVLAVQRQVVVCVQQQVLPPDGGQGSGGSGNGNAAAAALDKEESGEVRDAAREELEEGELAEDGKDPAAATAAAFLERLRAAVLANVPRLADALKPLVLTHATCDEAFAF
jgi:hypothetical protein